MDHHLWLWKSLHASRDRNAMLSGTLSPGRASHSSKISGNGPDKARSDAQWLGSQGNVLCTGTSCKLSSGSLPVKLRFATMEVIEYFVYWKY